MFVFSFRLSDDAKIYVKFRTHNRRAHAVTAAISRVFHGSDLPSMYLTDRIHIPVGRAHRDQGGE